MKPKMKGFPFDAVASKDVKSGPLKKDKNTGSGAKKGAGVGGKKGGLPPVIKNRLA